MKYLTSFLEQIEKSESLGSGTDKTPKSPARLPDVTPAPAPESSPGVRCDDCGQECTVTLVTDYGARYCRRCLRPEPLNMAKGRPCLK
jgi:hypothetical protein